MIQTQRLDEADKKKKIKVFDVLVVGGGPAGTAAAFRSRELGLKVLVIEYDDIMKRIRDYSKSKLILPGFGGADKMKFPKGGPLIASLAFEAIDKDDMVTRWKQLHQENKILSRVGQELTGFNLRKDGIYKVICWNHTTRREHAYHARHVVLAIGNGVPRRFDIPGNTDGIAFRLEDPAFYLGQPACVIGGGTSAAEAVIAISNAKIAAKDPSAVFWSYRGDKLPRVSKALAEVFFEAYAGNGNIRYYPKSEPAAIVTGPDHQDYLSIRIDRRVIADRPVETTHLEFAKTACVACIGEDLPEALLRNLGINLVLGGARNKKKVVVNKWLETIQPNVFMIGDILSQSYLRASDFEADPSQHEEVKHRGNIKSALRDGVYVAEVIKQRRLGKTNIQIVLEDMEEVLPPPTSVDKTITAGVVMRESLPSTPIFNKAEACLFRVLPNGMIESEHKLHRNGVTTIGRGESDIVFPDDNLLSNRHASVSHNDDGYHLWDGGSANGVFLLIGPGSKRNIGIGDLIRAGHQFLLICGDEERFWLSHYNQEGIEVATHKLSAKPLIMGRDAPDVTLDPEDMSLSRRHMAFSTEANKVVLKDLKSANGTFLRVRNSVKLVNGDQFQVGSEIFTLNETDTAAPKPVPSSKPASKASPVKAAPPSPGGASVTFQNSGKTFPVQPGQTICEVAEANGIAINAECHMGICGSDPIQIVSGAQYLTAEPNEGESETLEDLCGLEPGPCRLACMARVKGPVIVKIIQN